MNEMAAYTILHRQMQTLLDFLNLTILSPGRQGACIDGASCTMTDDPSSCGGVFVEGAVCPREVDQNFAEASEHLVAEIGGILAGLRAKSGPASLPFTLRAGEKTYRLDITLQENVGARA
jgi:hypothetical protein